MTKTYRPASEIIPGTIVRPFFGDERFNVLGIEHTPQGSVIFRDFNNQTVEMSRENPVEILGAFNLADDER